MTSPLKHFLHPPHQHVPYAGIQHTQILLEFVTLVERHSRYVMLAKVKDKCTENVVSALIKQAKKLPTELYKSLTWDRGIKILIKPNSQ